MERRHTSSGCNRKDMAKDQDSKFENSIFLKVGQSTVLRFPGLASKMIGLFGIGQSASTAAYRGLGEAVAAASKASQASGVAVALASSEGLTADSKVSTASAIASGTVLGVYEDTRFKSESKKAVLKSVDIIGLGTGPELEKKLKYVGDVCSGIIFGKELVNAPANVLSPGVLAEEASKIASLYSDVLRATILDVERF
ncbi:hypothetical protein ACHQM5_008595 [Ranunculus cassubicifolius]